MRERRLQKRRTALAMAATFSKMHAFEEHWAIPKNID
jgi:hypothetical protein